MAGEGGYGASRERERSDRERNVLLQRQKDEAEAAAAESQAVLDRLGGGKSNEQIIVEQDIKQGLDLGSELIDKHSDGAFGQVNTNLISDEEAHNLFEKNSGGVYDRLNTQFSTQDTDTALGRSSSILGGEDADILARRKGALGGLSSQALAAERSKAAEEINRQSESARRRLAEIQAAQGVRGGTAAAQQFAAVQGGAKDRANFERDLLLQQHGIQQQALGAYEGTVQAQQQQAFVREQFNLGQQLQERQLQNINTDRQFSLQQANLQKELQERELTKFNLGLEERRKAFKMNEFSLRSAERDLEKFNIDQMNKKLLSKTSLGLVIPQTLSAERIAQIQAAAAAAAARSGGGGGGISVLCTAVYSAGLMNAEVYLSDCEFGSELEKTDPALVRGYRIWATPVAKYLKSHRGLLEFVAPSINKWARSIHEGTDLMPALNIVEKCLYKFGIILSRSCYFLFGGKK